MEHGERQKILASFRDVVNMPPEELERWLESEASQEVGSRDDPGDESIGHASGRRIVEIQRTRETELTEDDYAHMQKVVGFVQRHLAQRPSGDVTHTRWRYALMNWGHDPLR